LSAFSFSLASFSAVFCASASAVSSTSVVSSSAHTNFFNFGSRVLDMVYNV
jgi:hypothetical protein